MTSYSHLFCDLRCPSCDAFVTDLVWFQWGYSGGYGVDYEQLYLIGDAIRWMTAHDGSTPAWTYFHPRGGNLGDPAITDLLVRDEVELSWSDPADRRRCVGCRHPLEGAAIEIRGGVIVRAWIYREGEIDRDVSIHVIESDGTRTPRPDWNNTPMPLIEGGRAPPPNAMSEPERMEAWRKIAGRP